MQIVYISNRPDILNDTLVYVKNLMDFISDVVIICPSKNEEQFTNPGFHRFSCISDESLLDASIKPLDKSQRNFLLRMALSNQEIINEEFIMSDDDYRPMMKLGVDTFIRNEKYRSYYFYHLENWRGTDKPFDLCQHNSFVILRHLQFDTLSFASHCPQIYSKTILSACKDRFSKYAQDMSLCEWAMYFNYAHQKYPEKFHRPEPYRTLCWPRIPRLWPDYISTPTYEWENYYEYNYIKGGIFQHVNPKFDIEEFDNNSIAKLMAYRTHEINRFQIPRLPESGRGLYARFVDWIYKKISGLDEQRFVDYRRELLRKNPNGGV